MFLQQVASVKFKDSSTGFLLKHQKSYGLRYNALSIHSCMAYVGRMFVESGNISIICSCIQLFRSQLSFRMNFKGRLM